MDFSEALRLLKTTKVSIRRESWSGNKHIRLVKPDNILPFIGIHTKDGKFGVYTSTNCDMLAEDWMVYEVDAKGDNANCHIETDITAAPNYTINNVKYFITHNG